MTQEEMESLEALRQIAAEDSYDSPGDLDSLIEVPLDEFGTAAPHHVRDTADDEVSGEVVDVPVPTFDTAPAPPKPSKKKKSEPNQWFGPTISIERQNNVRQQVAAYLRSGEPPIDPQASYISRALEQYYPENNWRVVPDGKGFVAYNRHDGTSEYVRPTFGTVLSSKIRNAVLDTGLGRIGATSAKILRADKLSRGFGEAFIEVKDAPKQKPKAAGSFITGWDSNPGRGFAKYDSNKPLEKEAVFLDTETGDRQEVLTYAAMKIGLQEGRPVLVDVKRKAFTPKTTGTQGWYEATGVNGLDEEILKKMGASAHYTDADAKELLDWIGNKKIVAYNGYSFDLPVLFGREGARKIIDEHGMLDPMLVYETFRGRGKGRNTLDAIYKALYGKDMPSHHAVEQDVRVMAKEVYDTMARNTELGRHMEAALVSKGVTYMGTSGGMLTSEPFYRHGKPISIGEALGLTSEYKVDLKDIEDFAQMATSTGTAGGSLDPQIQDLGGLVDSIKSLATKVDGFAQEVQLSIHQMSQAQGNISDVVATLASHQGVINNSGVDTSRLAVARRLDKTESVWDALNDGNEEVSELYKAAHRKKRDRLLNDPTLTWDDMEDIKDYVRNLEHVQKSDSYKQYMKDRGLSGNPFQARMDALSGAGKESYESLVARMNAANDPNRWEARQDRIDDVVTNMLYGGGKEAAELEAFNMAVQETKESLHELAKAGNLFNTALGYINNVLDAAPRLDYQQVLDEYSSQASSITGALSGLLPSFLSNPMNRFSSAIGNFNISGYAGRAAEKDILTTHIKAFADATHGIPFLEGVGGFLSGANNLRWALTDDNYMKNRMQIASFRETGQRITGQINLLSGIADLVAAPFRMLAGAATKLFGVFTAGASGFLNWFKGAMGSLSSLGVPLTPLTGIRTDDWQDLSHMDALTGHSGGSMNKVMEDMAYAQGNLYTMGQFDQSRVVAASLLGEFGTVYGYGAGNTEQQYGDMVNRLADRLAKASPEERRNITTWASHLDSQLPYVLTQLESMRRATGNKGLTYQDITKEGAFGMYERHVSQNEADRMYKARTEFAMANTQRDTTFQRIALDIWERFGKPVYNAFNEALDRLYQGIQQSPFFDHINGIIDSLKGGNWGEALQNAISAVKDLFGSFKNLNLPRIEFSIRWDDILQGAVTFFKTVNALWFDLLRTVGESIGGIIDEFSTLQFHPEHLLDGKIGEVFSFGAHVDKDKWTQAGESYITYSHNVGGQRVDTQFSTSAMRERAKRYSLNHPDRNGYGGLTSNHHADAVIRMLDKGNETGAFQYGVEHGIFEYGDNVRAGGYGLKGILQGVALSNPTMDFNMAGLNARDLYLDGQKYASKGEWAQALLSTLAGNSDSQAARNILYGNYADEFAKVFSPQTLQEIREALDAGKLSSRAGTYISSALSSVEGITDNIIDSMVDHASEVLSKAKGGFIQMKVVMEDIVLRDSNGNEIGRAGVDSAGVVENTTDITATTYVERDGAWHMTVN